MGLHLRCSSRSAGPAQPGHPAGRGWDGAAWACLRRVPDGRTCGRSAGLPPAARATPSPSQEVGKCQRQNRFQPKTSDLLTLLQKPARLLFMLL